MSGKQFHVDKYLFFHENRSMPRGSRSMESVIIGAFPILHMPFWKNYKKSIIYYVYNIVLKIYTSLVAK